jgi:hypothetical protein
MSGFFQNIDPPPLHRPAFGAGGGHTRWLERGEGDQYIEYFGRRQTLLCTLLKSIFLIPIF